MSLGWNSTFSHPPSSLCGQDKLQLCCFASMVHGDRLLPCNPESVDISQRGRRRGIPSGRSKKCHPRHCLGCTAIGPVAPRAALGPDLLTEDGDLVRSGASPVMNACDQCLGKDLLYIRLRAGRRTRQLRRTLGTATARNPFSHRCYSRLMALFIAEPKRADCPKGSPLHLIRKPVQPYCPEIERTAGLIRRLTAWTGERPPPSDRSL